jgi:lysozyme
MKTGKYGLALIKKAEGFMPNIYDDQGHSAIGYGQRLTQAECEKFKDGITEEEATELLTEFLGPLENTLNRMIKNVKLDQNQFDALVSFAYNVGIGNFMSSTMLKLINTGQLNKVEDEFAKWNKSGGKVLPGLVERRKVEAALWKGDFENEILVNL